MAAALLFSLVSPFINLAANQHLKKRKKKKTKSQVPVPHAEFLPQVDVGLLIFQHDLQRDLCSAACEPQTQGRRSMKGGFWITLYAVSESQFPAILFQGSYIAFVWPGH